MKTFFDDVKVGDKLTRMLAGTVPIEMEVIEVQPDRLICTDAKHESDADWEFDLATGAEIDEELGFGPPPKITGSFLVAPGGVYNKVETASGGDVMARKIARLAAEDKIERMN